MAKLNQHEAPVDEGESWLLSYADMMTLIACFFILMMAFANFDPTGFTKKTKVISKHFNKDKYKSSDLKLNFLQEEVSKHPNIKKMTKITEVNGDLIINFSGSTVFSKDSFELTEESIRNLDIMIEIIKKMNENFKVIAEGFSDKYEGKDQKAILGVWGLSGARAASVVERFEFHGFAPGQLTAVARGDTAPLFDSDLKDGTPNIEGRRMNQRVSLKLLTTSDAKPVKLGLGVYFKD